MLLEKKKFVSVNLNLYREVRVPFLTRFLPTFGQILFVKKLIDFPRDCRVSGLIRSVTMAAEQKATTEEVKMDLFEDDDEFEEFEINEGEFL